MDLDSGVNLITYVINQVDEEKLWSRWILHYQDSMSFEDFKTELRQGSNVSHKSDEAVLEDVREILSMESKVE